MQGVLVGSLAMRVGWTEERDEQGLEKSRSRGGLWVMLRDETPRGFIEERRGEKEERGRGGEEKRRKKEEECRSWLCSNSKEHSRRTLSLSLSPPFLLSFLRLFVFLSFSILRNGGSAARRKIRQATTGSRVMGMKNAFSSSFLLLSSTVSSPLSVSLSPRRVFELFFLPPSPPLVV